LFVFRPITPAIASNGELAPGGGRYRALHLSQPLWWGFSFLSLLLPAWACGSLQAGGYTWPGLQVRLTAPLLRLRPGAPLWR